MNRIFAVILLTTSLITPPAEQGSATPLLTMIIAPCVAQRRIKSAELATTSSAKACGLSAWRKPINSYNIHLATASPGSAPCAASILAGITLPFFQISRSDAVMLSLP